VRYRNVVLEVSSVAVTAASVIVLALLMGSHMPFQSERAPAGNFKSGTGRWQAVYILGADCPCSTRVAAHLAHSTRMVDADEQVAYVGTEPQAEAMLEQSGLKQSGLRQSGLRLARYSAEQAFDRFGARSAPLLLFIDPSGVIRYSGGFARRNDFRDGFQEARLWTELRETGSVESLPAFGCAFQFGCATGGLRAALGL
jgi:hypothetical protein